MSGRHLQRTTGHRKSPDARGEGARESSSRVSAEPQWIAHGGNTRKSAKQRRRQGESGGAEPDSSGQFIGRVCCFSGSAIDGRLRDLVAPVFSQIEPMARCTSRMKGSGRYPLARPRPLFFDARYKAGLPHCLPRSRCGRGPKPCSSRKAKPDSTSSKAAEFVPAHGVGEGARCALPAARRSRTTAADGCRSIRKCIRSRARKSGSRASVGLPVRGTIPLDPIGQRTAPAGHPRDRVVPAPDRPGASRAPASRTGADSRARIARMGRSSGGHALLPERHQKLEKWSAIPSLITPHMGRRRRTSRRGKRRKADPGLHLRPADLNPPWSRGDDEMMEQVEGDRKMRA